MSKSQVKYLIKGTQSYYNHNNSIFLFARIIVYLYNIKPWKLLPIFQVDLHLISLHTYQYRINFGYITLEISDLCLTFLEKKEYGQNQLCFSERQKKKYQYVIRFLFRFFADIYFSWFFTNFNDIEHEIIIVLIIYLPFLMQLKVYLSQLTNESFSKQCTYI